MIHQSYGQCNPIRIGTIKNLKTSQITESGELDSSPRGNPKFENFHEFESHKTDIQKCMIQHAGERAKQIFNLSQILHRSIISKISHDQNRTELGDLKSKKAWTISSNLKEAAINSSTQKIYERIAFAYYYFIEGKAKQIQIHLKYQQRKENRLR